MVAQSTIFPAFIRAEYDGSSNGWAEFEAAGDRTLSRVSSRMQRFAADSAEVGRVLKSALSSGDNLQLGRLDVGVDQLRQLAAQARLAEAATTQLFASARELAASTGDTTAATRSYLAALDAEATQARATVQATEAQITTYERLQAALDQTANRNNALANSYREVFAQQAAAARQEVRAGAIQDAVNSKFAPGLNSRATDNGAGFRALDEQVQREQALVARLNAELRELENQFARTAAEEVAGAQRAQAAQDAHAAALQRLREAEFGAAEGARLLTAMHSGTALEIGRTANSAAASASVFARYEAQLLELKAAIDPAFYAQRRFDEELAFAKTALAQGDISAAQYKTRLEQLTGQLAVNTQSTRSQRFAYVQLGQQLQDVAIQAQLGVNPLIILTQQGSQAAFALTGLGGTVGRVATFFAGPWGAAVLGATTALGLFYASMQDSEKASRSLGDGLDLQKMSVRELSAAISELEAAQRRQVQTSYDSEQAHLRDAAAALTAAVKTRELAIAKLQLARSAQASDLSSFLGGDEGGGLAAYSSYLDAQVRKLEEAQKKGESLVRAAIIPVARREADAASDPSKGINYRYDIAESNLQSRYQSGKISLDDYRSSLTNLTQARERDLDALKKHADRSGQAERAADRLRERGEDAAKKISNITDRFSDIPPQIAQVNRAMRELDDLATDFALKQPPNYEAIVTQLTNAKGLVRDALNKPLEDYLKTAREQEVIDEAILKGKSGQADALRVVLGLVRDMGPLTRDQLQTTLNTVEAERQRGKELDRLQQKQQAYLSALNGVRSTISSGIAGAITGQGGNIGEAIGDQLATLFATRLTDRLFGGMFSYLEDQITGGGDDIRDASDYLTEQLRKLGEEISNVRDQIAGDAPGSSTFNGAANDNGDATGTDILVTGRRLARVDPITALGNQITRVFEREFSSISNFFKDNADGAGLGILAGGAILGGSNSKVGSLIGGALGEKAGEKLAGGAFGKALGKFGEFLGPLGSIAGGLLGGLIGGLFAGPKPSASAVVTSVGGAAKVTGNNTEQQQAVSGLSVNLQSSLQKIIDQLGGTAGAFDVSIGKREDYYRVAGVATDAVSAKNPERGTGISLLYNGTDANEALRVAVLEAFKDGAVQGIREGTRKLLSGNQDIEIGVSKASKFEQVFKDLKKYTDPAGAALDALNLKFRQLKTIFDEAGASAQEYADLEDLYGRERADALKQVTEQITSGLKSFLSSLTTGDSGLSLRSRLSYAQAEYDPLAARVQAGDQSAYDGYTAAAQTLLDIQRQIYGSGEEYFATLDQVIAMTRGAILTEEAKLKVANDSGTPFDTTLIVSATEKQTAALIDALQPQLASIASSNRDIALAFQNRFGMTKGGYYDELARAANF